MCVLVVVSGFLVWFLLPEPSQSLLLALALRHVDDVCVLFEVMLCYVSQFKYVLVF